MFISYYTIIYFFVKNFFSNVYISVNTIFECSYLSFGWEIGHPLSMYVTRGMEGAHPKCLQMRTGGAGYHASFVRTHLHYLFSCFCLRVSCFICRYYLHLKKLCLSEIVTFLQWDQFLLQWNKLFFNRDLNRGCLVYMFSLRFSGSKFLINLQR